MALSATAQAAPGPKSEPIIIVDLRPNAAVESRDRLASALAGVAGIAVKRSASLDAALAGQPLDRLRTSARAALARAAAEYGKLRCGPASSHAASATAALAALQARDGDSKQVVADLERAYVYQFLCADGAGQTDRALQIAGRLRRLRDPAAPDSPPASVSPAIWNRYPAIDAATNVLMLKVKIESVPAGAVIYVDHRRVGVTPAEVTVRSGSHLLALSTAGYDPLAIERAVHQEAKISLQLTRNPATPGTKEIRRRVAAWRAKGASATGLAQLMRSVGVRFAMVMASNGVEVWGVQKYAKAARRLGRDRASASRALANLVLEHASAWDGRAPDPTLPLLREVPASKQAKRRQKWWVYASIIGAVAIGTAIIAGRDFADDRQRFQLVYP